MTAKPLYQEVKDHILARIREEALTVDDRVPSEAELVAALGVSRMTANRALNELTKAGVLTRIAGVGTFVSDRRAHGDLLTIRDIADELADQGHAHSMRVIAHEKVAASREAASAFKLKPAAPLISAKVIHARDGEPILFEDRLVNAMLIPEFADVDLIHETSHTHLMRLAPLQNVEHVVRAIPTPGFVAHALHVAPGAPCLLLKRRTWSGGEVASLVELYHAGERFEFSSHWPGDRSKGDTHQTGASS